MRVAAVALLALAAPVSTAVDSPLDKFRHAVIDPAIVLDERDRRESLWPELFLGGKPVKSEE